MSIERAVTSADGVTIAYRRVGTGPALLVVPGNNRMAHNYDRLAAALADVFTVCVLERRGRGNSGPQGPGYSIDREVDDVSAVMAAENAELVFGHSYGGLVALAAGRLGSGIRRLAVYEPGISINGSFDLRWRAEFRRLVERGKHVRAMALFLHQTRLVPLPWTPYAVCWSFALLMVGRASESRDLMPTTPPELDEIARWDGDGSPFATITAKTLLIAGTRSPEFLTAVIDPLHQRIAGSVTLTLTDADHNAPDENDPERVAAELRTFFGA
jgi:pimeloyl-ACP methyl ester carboxylesterase